MSEAIDRAGRDPGGGAGGYTLVELCVAVTLTLAVAGLLLAGYVEAVRWVRAREAALALENDGHLALRRLTDDLLHAEWLWQPDEQTWALGFASGDTARYALEAGTLLRNDTPVHGAGTEVTTARLVPAHRETRYARRSPDPAGDSLLVHVSLALRRDRDTLALDTVVLLRARLPWPPVDHDPPRR